MLDNLKSSVLTLLPIALLLSLLMLLPDEVIRLLAYQRDNGQWWDVVTAGWIHFELSHFLGSLVGLLVMWLLFADYLQPLPVWLMLLMAAIGSVLFEHWLAQPPFYSVTVVENRGFSGALYGFFAWGATLDVIKRKPFGWVLWLLVIGKVVLEAVIGEPLLSFSRVDRVAVMGHLGGAVSGVCMALLYWQFYQQQQSK